MSMNENDAAARSYAANSEKLSGLITERYERAPRVYVRTYGCQQNVNDSERIKGILVAAGFVVADAETDADMIVFNTCAVREHAEDRVFGNVGALKPLKEKNRKLIIALCGCMVEQSSVLEKIKQHYPYVDLVFDTNALWRLPQLLCERLEKGKRVFDTLGAESAQIVEQLPLRRDDTLKAWLPIMYGCDNFCTYCIVPYVRHRERSRRSGDILAEFKEIVAGGAKEITLLGQNVNSYGKNSGEGLDFADLLALLAQQPGDFTIRFMTSHPKDASRKLIDTIAEYPKISRHFHLPVQSGSNDILRKMNRGYTAEKYLELVEYARKKIPDLSLTSDIIVGFPGESRADFEQTLKLVKKVRYRSLFIFIYSKRTGTSAARLADETPHAEKAARLRELTAVQDAISAETDSALVGRTLRGLAESYADGCNLVRLDSNAVVFCPGAQPLPRGTCTVTVTSYENRKLFGKV